MVLQFTATETNTNSESFTLLEFQIINPEGIIQPSELKLIQFPEIDTTKGLILSGRGPVWLFGYLAHHYHITPWLASYDPGQGGGIVFSTHSMSKSVGNCVKVTLPKKTK
jgi:CRISPR-associated protein Csx3